MAAQKKSSTASKSQSKSGKGTQRKTQTKKAVAANQRNQKRKTAASQSNEHNSIVSNDIKIIAGFALMVLLELSNFSMTGRFGNIISRFMFGMFGLFAYVDRKSVV